MVMKCRIAIQAFTAERVQVLVNDGNLLVEEALIDNGNERIFDIEATYTMTVTEVKKWDNNKDYSKKCCKK